MLASSLKHLGRAAAHDETNLSKSTGGLSESRGIRYRLFLVNRPAVLVHNLLPSPFSGSVLDLAP